VGASAANAAPINAHVSRLPNFVMAAHGSFPSEQTSDRGKHGKPCLFTMLFMGTHIADNFDSRHNVLFFFLDHSMLEVPNPTLFNGPSLLTQEIRRRDPRNSAFLVKMLLDVSHI
jgi:hypothetical protein